jgi:hypothetical protein
MHYTCHVVLYSEHCSLLISQSSVSPCKEVPGHQNVIFNLFLFQLREAKAAFLQV